MIDHHFIRTTSVTEIPMETQRIVILIERSRTIEGDVLMSLCRNVIPCRSHGRQRRDHFRPDVVERTICPVAHVQGNLVNSCSVEFMGYDLSADIPIQPVRSVEIPSVGQGVAVWIIGLGRIERCRLVQVNGTVLAPDRNGHPGNERDLDVIFGTAHESDPGSCL